MVLLTILSAAAGCGRGAPPSYERTAILQYGIPGRGAITLAWENEPGRALGSRIDLASDTLTVTTLDGNVAQYGVADGRRYWDKSFKGGIPAGAISSGDKLLIAKDGDYSRLHCLSRSSGDDVWSLPYGEILSVPVIADELIYFASRAGWVRACSLATGTTVWEQKIPGPVRGGLSLSDSILYLPTLVDTLFALSATSGETIWSAAPGGALYGAPAACGDRTWTISYEGQLCGWNRLTGALLSNLKLSENYRSGVIVAGTRLLLFSVEGILTVLNEEDLTVSWRVDLSGVADQPPKVDDDLVWVGLRNGMVHALRVADGKSLVTLQVPAPVTAPIAVCGRFVIISAGGGQLIAFRRDQTVSEPSPTHGRIQERTPPSLAGFSLSFAERPNSEVMTSEAHSRFDAVSRQPAIWKSAASDNAVSTDFDSGAMVGRLKFKEQLIWLTGWIGGSALALWCQHEADGAYEDYQQLGATDSRDQAFRRAERFDRYALAAWVGAEACFLAALKNWLSGGDEE
jgi:outer membrane protein assembly factor BamB